MFENLKRKSSKKLPNTKSTSTSKILKKESIELLKRNHYEIAINTESLSPKVTQKSHLKDKKCKSQCVSKEQINDRKSVDLKKMLLTTRTSTVMKKKIKDKCHLIDQVFTQHRQSKQRPVLVAKIDTEGGRSKRNESKQLSRGRLNLPWDPSKIPYTCTDTLKNYYHFLTKYEQSQIREYKKIYYIGHLASKRQAEGQGFDNEEREYIFVEHDHVAYRYEMLAVIGKGSYGQVIRAYDHKLQEQIALKIIKNKQKFSKQAYTEIKILTFIKEHDPHLRSNAVRIKDFVLFRKHVCILFEMLGENLYELIMRNNYSGLNFELIRRFALQLLTGLQFLRDCNIIHCDLKPENILLIKQNKPLLRIIDFGSSCFDQETIYTYIQSRYYRAPQITLGMPYGMQIDIWSIGCIFAQLYTGVPIFPGQNEKQQMKYMVDTLGKPSKSFLSYGSRSRIFFTEEGDLNGEIKAEETVSHFSQALRDRIEDEQFCKFIQLLLKWNPYERINPLEAMRHPWILKGLPEELQLKILKKTELPEEKQSRPNSKSKSQSKEKRSSIKVQKPSGPEKISKGFGIKF